MNQIQMDFSDKKQACIIPRVMRSAFGYRFKITSKENNKVFGTGFFKVSKEFSKDEQIDFLHQYTNGYYLNKKSFINIDIFEADA